MNCLGLSDLADPASTWFHMPVSNDPPGWEGEAKENMVSSQLGP